MEQLTATSPLKFMSTRLVREPTINKRPKLSSPEEIANFLKERLDLSYDREVLGVICLSPQLQVNSAEICSVGAVDGSLCSCSEIFRSAILSASKGIILFHTHPTTDNSNFSPDDVASSLRVFEAAKIIGLQLLDHIVLAGNGTWKSLRQIAEPLPIDAYCRRELPWIKKGE